MVYEINRIIVRNSLHTDFIPPYWETNELLAAFAYKLRRLIVVHGTKRGGRVKYESARLYWEPQLSGIVQALTSGVMAIDFDARTTDGSGLGLRDHEQSSVSTLTTCSIYTEKTSDFSLVQSSINHGWLNGGIGLLLSVVR